MRRGKTEATIEHISVNPPTNNNLPVAELIEQALTLHRSGRLREAATIYESILQAQPRHPDALHFLGVIAHQAGKHEIALNLIEDAIKINPTAPAFHNNCGDVYRALEKDDRAIACYKQAISIRPGYAEAHYKLGNIFYESGRLEECIACYEQAISIRPAYAEAHYNLGVVLQKLGRHEAFTACFEQAISIKPDFVEAHFNLGVAHQELGRSEAAIACFEQTLDIRPDYAEAHNNLGRILQQQGRLDEAVARYQQALVIKPELAETYYNMGTALQELGKPEEAFLCQRRAVDLYPNNDIFWSGLAASLESLLFTAVDDNLWQVLEDLLDRPAVSPAQLTRPIISALQLHPDFMMLLERENIDTRNHTAYSNAARRLASIPLLLKLMGLSIIDDLRVERMLTGLRRLMILELLSGSSIDDENCLPFAAALALQCFANEYVFHETTLETTAVERLGDEIEGLMKSKEAMPVALLLALAAYRPLNHFPWAGDLLKLDWRDDLNKVINRQVKEAMEEMSLRNKIPKLTPIRTAVSQAVRDQYEENPYPRWIRQGLHANSMTISGALQAPPLRLDLGNYVSPDEPQILVAGCGTGQIALSIASRFSDAIVLAVDLSLSSLSYAMRKTREHGLKNIEYAQADILELGDLGRQFDLIDCSGVLHHLADPLSGWRVLVGLLRPDGLMKIGLYSELARRSVVQGRALIARKGYTAAAKDIRQCRQDIIAAARDRSPNMMQLTGLRDFYSLSECRDLLFHVQEHHFTLLQIEAALEDLGLGFLGFETNSQSVMRQFNTTCPGKAARLSLSLWHKFETRYPDTFLGMYQFWAQKIR